MPRRRLAPGEPRGDLGVTVNPMSEGAWEIFRVSGAAAEAGIQLSDAIVSVDGFDVLGDNRYLLTPLMEVPAGRAVTLGLARGAALRVIARGR